MLATKLQATSSPLLQQKHLAATAHLLHLQRQLPASAFPFAATNVCGGGAAAKAAAPAAVAGKKEKGGCKVAAKTENYAAAQNEAASYVCPQKKNKKT